MASEACIGCAARVQGTGGNLMEFPGRSTSGNLAYVVHAEEGAEPPAFILYEQYTDRAAFDAHAASEHFAEYILGTVRPRLTQRDVLFGQIID